MRQSKGLQFTVVFVCALVALATVALFSILANTVFTTAITFDNDEANHAIDGWEVVVGLKNGSPAALWRAIAGQGFYPPVHSFFVAGSYLLAGPGLASSRLPTLFLFALTLASLAWITFRIARRDEAGDPASADVWLPIAGAAFAVAFAITSELFVSLSVLIMLEMTGAFLGLLLLLTADQADMVHADRKRWSWIAAASFIAMTIFLTKYSFGLFFMPALVIALLTASWPWKATRRTWLEVAAVLGIHLFIAVFWLLITDRTTLGLFFTDHRSDAPILSAANLLYLPGLWFGDYSSSVVVGLIAVALAVFGAIRQWTRLAVRVAAWSILVALAILTISTTNEPRHFLPVAPAIWMLAGLGLVDLWRRLQRRSYGVAITVASMLLLLVMFTASAARPATALQSTLMDAFEGQPGFVAVQDYALRAVDLDQPVLFIGDFDDQNGLLAMRWRAATLLNHSTWELEIDFFPYEQYAHSIERTNRKPQITDTDPDFPHTYMNEVLDQHYYPSIIEIKHVDNYYGPRAANPDDPLCVYPATDASIGDWVVTVYATSPADRQECAGD